MRQISSFLRTAIAALLLLGNASAVAGYDFGEDGIYYNINGDGSTVSVTSEGITGWLTYTKNLTVPANVTHNGTTYTVKTFFNLDCKETLADIVDSLILQELDEADKN